ncbi:hypothetical protein TcWFU_002483 [Taenia crassiceps]|uniref:Uncharacterized protein n=1 Tax=Taenia crassiceps TaxID=6207 RepID=A0ABR4QG30_9CEST
MVSLSSSSGILVLYFGNLEWWVAAGLSVSSVFVLALSASRRFVSLDTVRVGWVPGLQEPNAPVPGRNPVWSETSSEIFQNLKSGDNLFVHGASGTPVILRT